MQRRIHSSLEGEELKDLIDDNPTEESEEDSDASGSKKRKKSDDEDFDDRLKDDYDLIEENLGIKVERKHFKRLRRIHDEESEEEQEKVADNGNTIANELFEASGDNSKNSCDFRSQAESKASLDDFRYALMYAILAVFTITWSGPYCKDKTWPSLFNSMFDMRVVKSPGFFYCENDFLRHLLAATYSLLSGKISDCQRTASNYYMRVFQKFINSMKCNNSGKSILKTCSTSATRQIAKLVLRSLQTDRRGTEETCTYIFLNELKMMKIFCETCPSDEPWFIKSSKVWSGRQAHHDYRRQKRTDVKSIVFFIELNFIYYRTEALYTDTKNTCFSCSEIIQDYSNLK
ncbi:hypothetical protein K0M31_011178 [Melipona bicolor]|uniref:Spt6 acidic N-terminal domain-containing protein n=1 Tax=Melipona bicolor TaxID=60889 RepID=A0AA40G913_9HYME|nr:hypothetical protein K0M31_011178 [Melipona bicolor]